jgi:hypothetical protein
MTLAPTGLRPPAAYYRGLDPEQAIPDLQAIIEHAIRNRPRTLQKTIGPSSLGSACDRCLIAELAQVAEDEPYAAWLPTLGVALGEWLEAVVIQHLITSRSDRYIPEGRVSVGTVGGVPVTGSTDVFDAWTGTVIDYKLVGTTTLRKMRKEGASLTYQRQCQVYGKGWEDAGYVVKSVAVWALPRNGFRISDGYLHQEPYDRAIAEATIARADMFACAINTLGVDQVLASAGPHTGTEFSCPDPKAEEKAAKQLDGLLIPEAPGATRVGQIAG